MKLQHLFAVMACALSLAAAEAASAQQVLHEERSLYRNIFIVEEDGERCMLFRTRRRVGRESCMYVDQPDLLVFDYIKMMLAGLYVNPNPKRILIIGMGGATLPSALQEMLPRTQIDVVELDDAVNRAARAYFDFRPSRNTRVVIEDGRVFVRRASRQGLRYDMVMLDAFEDDYIPEHLLTREFLGEVKRIMTPQGVIVANTWSSSGLYAHESATYAAVFGEFYNMRSGNRVIISRLGGLLPPEQLRANAVGWGPALAQRGAHSGLLLSMMSRRRDWDPATRVLTDQYSPSNLLNSSRD